MNESHNPRLQALVRKRRREGFQIEPEIVFETDSEGEAFDMEMKLIASYGRADLETGTLFNFKEGGEGGTGYQYKEHSTKEQREERAHKALAKKTRNQLILAGEKAADTKRRNAAERKRARKPIGADEERELKQRYKEFVISEAPKILAEHGGRLEKSEMRAALRNRYVGELPLDEANAYGHAFRSLTLANVTQPASKSNVYSLRQNKSR